MALSVLGVGTAFQFVGKNDSKTIVWREKILSVSEAKTHAVFKFIQVSLDGAFKSLPSMRFNLWAEVQDNYVQKLHLSLGLDT